MFNDKFIIEASCNYVYRIPELVNKNSSLNKYIAKHYPNYKIIDIQECFSDTNLALITIQDILSLDTAIIYQGSTNLKDWSNDNLNNFLNKNINQYDAALKYFKHMEKDYRITHIGGNSLGGGCAQYVGLKYPHVRAICINAAPLTSYSVIDTNNIYNIRVISDPLYRCVSLDKERYENGYVGNIILIKRSLYGSYDYYNTIELSHRGTIIFPQKYIYNTYKANNLTELKDKVDKKTYQKYAQLRKAPSLAQFISFDLITNNIDKKGSFDLDELQDNFGYRIKELNNSLIEYTLKNLELKIGAPLIHINDEISENLKAIIKYSLLHITKQEEKLYDNIYFIIEKSTNYFFKLIVKDLQEISDSIDSNSATSDYNKILKDIDVNRECLNKLIDYLIEINNELYNYDEFSLKNIFPNNSTIKFDYQIQSFSLDYQKIIYDKIDKTISDNISKNRLFVEQLDNIIGAALVAEKINLHISSVFGKNKLEPKDIDYIMKKYDLANIIEEALIIFREDIHETILAESLLFNYQNNITNINEQLMQLIKNLDNLSEYIVDTKDTLRRKKLLQKIDNVKKYVCKLIEYNNHSITIKACG